MSASEEETGLLNASAVAVVNKKLEKGLM